MSFPSIFLAVLTGLLIVAIVLLIQRQLSRGMKVTTLALLARISTSALYMVFAAIATSLLSVLLSSPASFADGMFRIITGAPLIWTFTSAHLLLAFVVLVFVAAAAGFFIVHGWAADSRPVRRFLRGMSRSTGGRDAVPGRYPAPKQSGAGNPPD